jgi:hypothetical protein
MNSASLCSLAGRYDNPIPPRFLAPIDFLKIPALSFGEYFHIGRKDSIHTVIRTSRRLDSFLYEAAQNFEVFSNIPNQN